MTNRDADRQCERIAREHHGIISKAEALAAGMSVDGIRSRVKSGRWRQVHPGVYLLAPCPWTFLAQAAAAIKWSRTGLCSHSTAAALHRLDGYSEGTIEISSPNGGRADGVSVHRLTPNDRPARRWIQSLPVTAVERTILDVAGCSPPPRVGRALDDALRKRLTTLARLQQTRTVECRKGRSGSRVFSQLLALRDDRDERVASDLETRMLRIMKKIRCERVIPNYKLEVGAHRYSIDFAFPKHLVGIETHGLRWHFGEDKWKEDLRRDRALTLAGWSMLYFSRDDVVWSSGEVLTQIGQVLDRSPTLF